MTLASFFLFCVFAILYWFFATKRSHKEVSDPLVKHMLMLTKAGKFLR